jgi:hypothetical protein
MIKKQVATKIVSIEGLKKAIPANFWYAELTTKLTGEVAAANGAGVRTLDEGEADGGDEAFAVGLDVAVTTGAVVTICKGGDDGDADAWIVGVAVMATGEDDGDTDASVVGLDVVANDGAILRSGGGDGALVAGTIGVGVGIGDADGNEEGEGEGSGDSEGALLGFDVAALDGV